MDLFGETTPAPEEKPENEARLFTEQAEIEAAAEDAEEGPTSPRRTFQCIGHEAQERQILESLGAGQMPHGLIFNGPRGIGKATFAFRLARFLLAQRGAERNGEGEGGRAVLNLDMPPNDPVCRKIAAGAHPDLLTIERAYDAERDRLKDSVAVEDIRKVAPFLRMTASQGGWRIVIVDDADTMNRNAQNALLKILEEPPANALLILIAHCMGTMVPTIRSRCRVIGFRAPEPAGFESVLRARAPDLEPANMETLRNMAEGSIGEALRLMENGGLDMPAHLIPILEAYPAWPWTQIHALADELARTGGRGANYESFRDALLWLFRHKIAAMAKGRAESEDLTSFMRHSSLASLLKICENLEKHFDTVQKANLDKRQAVLSAFHLIAG